MRASIKVPCTTAEQRAQSSGRRLRSGWLTSAEKGFWHRAGVVTPPNYGNVINLQKKKYDKKIRIQGSPVADRSVPPHVLPSAVINCLSQRHHSQRKSVSFARLVAIEPRQNVNIKGFNGTKKNWFWYQHTSKTQEHNRTVPFIFIWTEFLKQRIFG